MIREMTFMQFLKEFLKEHKVIYTVRKYPMVSSEVRIDGIGKCFRRYIGKISKKEELLEYVSLSGFPTLEKWVTAINSFIATNEPWYLYKVEIINGDK